MTNEMPHELSKNQPPAWEGKPNSNKPASEPEPQPRFNPPTRLDFGAMLGRIWQVLRSTWREHFFRAFLIASGFALLAIVTVNVGVQNVSDEAWAVLQGRPLEISDQPTTSELEALLRVLIEVFSLVAWLLPSLLIAQLLISALSTKITLNHPAYGHEIKNVPWVKIITANLAVTLILMLFFVPMIIAIITNQIALGGLLLFIALGFAIWFGIGIIILIPLVLDTQVGGIDAVRGALKVSKGHRLPIFGISLLIGIVGSLLTSTLTQFVSLLPAASDALWYFVLTNFIPLALSLPLSAIAATVLYLNYKTRS